MASYPDWTDRHGEAAAMVAAEEEEEDNQVVSFYVVFVGKSHPSVFFNELNQVN